MKIRKVDASAMAPSLKKSGLSPRQQARNAEAELIRKAIISRLSGPDDVFEVKLEDTEKIATVRQRILRVAKDTGVDIAVQRRGENLLVGLMTPDRKSRRGRRPKSETA